MNGEGVPMNSRRIVWAIVRRDLRVLAASKTTAIPMVLLPVLFFAVIPWLMGTVPSSALNLPAGDVDTLLRVLPASAVASLPADPEAQLVVVVLVYLLAPMFLLVPLLISIIAAAGSVAGERERRTLEVLLLSPVTDRQLFLAKTIGAWVPAVLITLLGSVVYQGVATVALAGTGARPFPNLMWTLLVVWVAPALAAAALGAVVMISARMGTYQEALQVSGLLVIPVVGVVVAQAAGVLTLGAGPVAVMGLVLWVLAAVLLRAGATALRRNTLAARL